MEKREIHCHHANSFPSNQFIAKFFSKTLIWRNFCKKYVAVKFRNFHNVFPQFPHCFTTKIFYQKFRQINVLLKKNFTINWSDGKIICLAVNFSFTENKFRQINYLVILLLKPLISRNFCEKSVKENFCNFHKFK